ncbi:CPBP family intramembrane metalloprotease [Alloscardovia theropitheci]|uniref:CPBP family intramembrane metalloprotease n=1 Tax=Alloscardovia theropitheci TaxID=2496842 RepID=A0A4R0QZN4_9BIFI|nr:CPBP family intramembrane glutamic endopeptidase [Alloscardovia theropitheci]TCD54136.1 CPBP family intramembrane metalloprotease [Alloscardovia theropitheci]
MTLFIHTLIPGIIQYCLALLIAVIWWRISTHKKEHFTTWIGYTRITGGAHTILHMMISLIILFLSGSLVHIMIPGLLTATSQYQSLGWAALPTIIVHAVLNTSGWEEIIFRSLILKRLTHITSMTMANIIQATLFGLLHGIPLFFILQLNPFQAMLITIVTGFAGWYMGYINEHYAHGSILLSWIIHATANVIAALLSAFTIL